MDSKSENEVVVEALICAQVATQHALECFRTAKNSSKEDCWWSAYDYHVKEFNEYRNCFLNKNNANIIIEAVLSPAIFLPGKILVKFILSKSQRKYQGIDTYEC